VCGAGAHGAAGGIGLLSGGERLACGNGYGRLGRIGAEYEGDADRNEHRDRAYNGHE